ncbi:DNA-binding protein [Steroidobacter flavus]|uniref:DNA-binding protein n=1 Tax=Steroidobacter flavus TaxID=1842136 RepID=A0ABV8SNA6_9GAMM
MKKARKKRAKVKVRSAELAPFNVCDFLDNEEVIAEYLAASLEDPNPETYLRAMAHVAKSETRAGRAE